MSYAEMLKSKYFGFSLKKKKKKIKYTYIHTHMHILRKKKTTEKKFNKHKISMSKGKMCPKNSKAN